MDEEVPVWRILDGSTVTRDLQKPESGHQMEKVDVERTSAHLWQHSQGLSKLRQIPPSYLDITSGSQVTLPLLRWTFRGFTIAMWIFVPPLQETKKIRLFKFYSTSKIQGIECWVTPSTDQRVTLSVASVTDDKGWRHVSSQFQWTPNKWHFVVVCHRQHYLKKSHVVSYVDAIRVMNEDLSFPTLMGPMSQCLIGGPDANCTTGGFHLSGMTMYEDELPMDVISTLFRYGPTQTCVRRVFAGVNPFQHSLLDTDGLCPLTTVEKSTLYSMHPQLKVAFSFSAQDVFFQQGQPPLCVQWTSEGDVDGLWTRLKLDADPSPFSQENHVILDSDIQVKSEPNRSNDWFRFGGILSIPVLLDKILDANTGTLVTDALHLMQGLLRTSIAHQEDMLHGFGFHILSYVLRTHEEKFESLLTPSIATTCVELVLDLWFSESKISTMPLFAAGMHGLLLDFYLWNRAPFKTQSILIQQVLLFATENPRCLQHAIQVQHLIDILRCYYVKKSSESQWIDECVSSLVMLMNQSLMAIEEKEVLQVVESGSRNIRIPLRLVQDLRVVCRFLIAAPDALITRAILNNLSENLDNDVKKLALVASNIFDVLLYLLGPKHGWGIRIMAVRLFVLLYEWMETDVGRNLLQNTEKQYQMEVVVDPRLWNEFAHDASFMMGLQHTVALNDVTNRTNEMSLSDSLPASTNRKDSRDWKAPTWWKLNPTSNRLVLTYADRLLVLRSIALRQIQQGAQLQSPEMQRAFSSSIQWLLTLPARGIVPFVAYWFLNSPSITENDREKVLMEISVMVKTDKEVQNQLVDQPWTPWFADLLLSCAKSSAGEDLVLDTTIILMCRVLYNAQGWLCLDSLFSKFPDLAWRRRVLGLVFIRTARTKAMLSRAMGENLYRLLMFATYLLVQDSNVEAEFLTSASLDITEMLLESTHEKHRAGVAPALRLCRLLLPQVSPALASRMIHVLETGLQQEVGQRMPVDESVPTQDMLLRVLQSLAVALQNNPDLTCGELVLRIATSGLFERDELTVDRLSGMDTQTAAIYALGILVDEPTSLHSDEMVDWSIWMPKWFPTSNACGNAFEKPSAIDAASQVEEKRVWEVLKDILKKEQERMSSHDTTVRLRHQWTEEGWKHRKYKVLSEHQWENYVTPSKEYQLTRHEMPHPTRRRHRLDVYFKPTITALPHPAAMLSRDELEKVGRAIAKEGGAIVDTAVESLEEPNIPDESIQQSIEVPEDDDEEEKSAMPIQSQFFSFLHPSSGPGLQPNDRIYLQPLVRKVVPEGLILGTLYICDHVAVFQPQAAPSTPNDVELAAGLQSSYRWSWKEVVAVYLRQFRLRESAIEIFLQNGSAHFFDFHAQDSPSTPIRNETARMILAMCPRATVKQWPMVSPNRLVGNLTKEWQMRLISNYDYLMALNTLAGRSFNDLTQYPVFPWVLSNYTSTTLDLNDASNFRALGQPMGALNPDRLAEYWERYHSFDDPDIPKFLYGSHYSTAAGVVLYFLMRLQPFATLHQLTQGGSFDLPDRLFNSVADVWDMCNSSMSEVKELTPEWYSTPAFLRNLHQYDLGTRQDGHVVGDVALPPWANDDPEQFIRIQRAALESDYVSAHLHEWIDLIFGYQQRGPDALAANNVFYYLTYSGLVDLDSIEDPQLRTAMEQQIAHFGQCPQQLFRTPHPARGSGIRPLQEHVPYVTKSLSGNLAMATMKILSDRLLGVNALGVIELHHWKVQKDGERCQLKVERDNSPFEVVPRLPLYSTAVFPVCVSSQGRVFVSGGAPTGTIHIRLIDLENGHVLARASVDGHTEIVTCLAMDSLGEDEFFVSGSRDCSLLLWQLSQMNSPFRPPRITSCPIMVFRGHKQGLISCAISVALGVVVSASETTCLVHNLHTGSISFGFYSPPYSVFQHVAISSKGYIIACAKINDTSVIKVYNMLGICIRQEPMEFCSGLIMSQEGALLLASLNRSLRCYRLDDFAVVHEYWNPKNHGCAISCAVMGPQEAVMLAVTGHVDGSLVWHLLPDADGRISLLGSVGRFLNINSKLKVVKGTVQQAQKLAISTIDNAQAVTNTAKDIADEAKSMMQSIFGLFK
ncbi:Aste57867_2508 [Aphanomyces stellatus]|uniref:Aste57867_2508 protein n=1 Tax=Aphanomyces stellatus TaxID=120398 RepID=A0A485KBF8_9STRA|nr:hypothetical protein As57867_002501 [Aphanomyces stellatus]VFT79707.1 Aste57867_2508 [Aphanomyces stellatus]